MKATFIRRAKGMDFEEFKRVCIQRFIEVGLIKSEPVEDTSELPDEFELQAHVLCEKGLTEYLDKIIKED